MKVLKIGFVVTRTDRPAAMVDFFERTLALTPMHGGDDMWAFRLPDGSVAEVFGPTHNDYFTTGPWSSSWSRTWRPRPRSSARPASRHVAR